MYTTTTGAMKNAFGGLLSKYRHYTHTWIHETLVDLLAIQKEIHPGIFAVMDGTTAGNGPGPRLMEPVVKNVILASADQVAIDAVAAKLMGFDPLSIKYIRLAHERGLGVGDAREIELVGDDVSGENWGFKVGYSTHTFLAWLSWYGPTQGLPEAGPAHAAGGRADLHRRGRAGLHVLAAEVQARRRKLARRNRLGAVIPAVSTRRLSGASR